MMIDTGLSLGKTDTLSAAPPELSLYRNESERIRSIILSSSRHPNVHVQQGVLEFDGSDAVIETALSDFVFTRVEELPEFDTPSDPNSLHHAMTQLGSIVTISVNEWMSMRDSNLPADQVSRINPRTVVGRMARAHLRQFPDSYRHAEDSVILESDLDYEYIPSEHEAVYKVVLASFWHLAETLELIEQIEDEEQRLIALERLVQTSRHVLKERSPEENERLQAAQAECFEALATVPEEIGSMFTGEEVAARARIAICSASEPLVRELAVQAGITIERLDELLVETDDEYPGSWYEATPEIAGYAVSPSNRQGVVATEGPFNRGEARERMYRIADDSELCNAALATSLVTVDILLRWDNPEISNGQSLNTLYHRNPIKELSPSNLYISTQETKE